LAILATAGLLVVKLAGTWSTWKYK